MWDGIGDKQACLQERFLGKLEGWKCSAWDGIVRRGTELFVVGWDWGEKQESAGSNFPLQSTRTETFFIRNQVNG